MEQIKQYIGHISWDTVIYTSAKVALVLSFALIVVAVLKRLLARLEKRLLVKGRREGEPPSESHKRVETIIRLIRQASLIALWTSVGLVLLSEFGVSIGPLIASAGILGLAIGFGAQNLVRDVISGFFMILENQIRVGDVAILNDTGGLVERISFRTTVLRDLAGVVHVFPNGAINSLSNMTNDWSAYVFDIGVAYKEDTDRVITIMKQVGDEMLKDKELGELMLEAPEIFGVDKFGDSAVVIKGRLRTRPIRQWTVGREFLRRVKYAFDENGIEIPFPHRTLYFGEDSKPFDLQVLDKLVNSGRSAVDAAPDK
jgi:small conductance mechanosensitive channel